MKESEDNLENFFRNRAESNQYEFKEADWEKMKAKLDAEMPVVSPYPFSKYAWMGLGAVITAAFFISYILFTSTPKTSDQAKRNQEISAIENPTQASELGMASETQNMDNEATNEKIVANSGKKNHQQDVVKIGNQSKKVHRAKSVNENSGVASVVAYDKNSSSKINESTTMIADTDTKIVANNRNDHSPIIVADQKKAVYQFSEYGFVPSKISSRYCESITPKPRRVYTLSLLGGLDITSTPKSAWGTPTFRVGASGEYFVGKRWSIGIGANLSTKKYQAKGAEYSPPEGFWTNGVVPDSTNAICDVLDVPVSVSYFQPISNKSNLIISGGFSSWFMLKEDYWYKYKSNDPNLVSWWGGENENRYWFSVINLSLAYEYDLNKKWSLAVGPYVNIPLSGVGHGNVELQSFGLRGALRFTKFKLSKF